MVRSDAAWDENKQAAGLGWILLAQPQNQAYKERVPFVTSPLMAEALALRNAVMLCQRSRIMKVRFESDSAQLIKIINSEAIDSELHGVVTDIFSCISAFEFVCFAWIPRERNMFADALAKDALTASGQFMVDGAVNALN